MPADGRWDLTRRLKGYTITVSCTCTSTDSAFTLSLKLDQKVFFLWSLRTMHVLSWSCMASTFSWWWSLPSCFCANFWISLVTTSTCRSLCALYWCEICSVTIRNGLVQPEREEVATILDLTAADRKYESCRKLYEEKVCTVYILPNVIGVIIKADGTDGLSSKRGRS